MTTKAQVHAHDIDVSLSIAREASDESNMLRCFWATVSFIGGDSTVPEEIGLVTGWICWDIYDGDVAATVADAVNLAVAAAQIQDSDRCLWVDAAIMVDRMVWNDQGRGLRLSKMVVENLVDLLQLDPTQTVVVLQPEPQRLGQGGPYKDGPERDALMAKLHEAYSAAGFEPWDGSLVWWRPTDS